MQRVSPSGGAALRCCRTVSATLCVAQHHESSVARTHRKALAAQMFRIQLFFQCRPARDTQIRCEGLGRRGSPRNGTYQMAATTAAKAAKATRVPWSSMEPREFESSLRRPSGGACGELLALWRELFLAAASTFHAAIEASFIGTSRLS